MTLKATAGASRSQRVLLRSLRMLRVKLRYAAEKEVLDLNTGKMIPVEQARVMHRGMVSAEAVGDGPDGGPADIAPHDEGTR